MKTSLRKNKFWALVFTGILIIVLLNAFQKNVKSFFCWFSFPIQRTLWSAGNETSDFFEGILKISSLKNELDIVKQQNQEFSSQFIEIKKLEEENKILREALNLGLEENLKLSFAAIIAKSPSEDLIFIDKGLKDGILEGMPVITEQKVLAGKIDQVYKNYSIVRLASNKKMSFDVKIYREEKDISAIANGQGNLDILLDLIPREEEIFKGDIVSTSCLGGNFPDSLLIGKIKEITKKDTESFQTAKIEPAFNLEEANHLFIITNF